jgi:lysophospholipase L1-like esterase
MLPKLFPLETLRPDIMLVTILLGANDSVAEGEPQHVPLEEYEANIKSIVDHMMKINTEMRIVLITPPPVDNLRWPNRHNNYVSKYAAVIRSVASEKALLVVDLWDGDFKIDDGDLNDGLHMGTTGNGKILDAVKATVRACFPDLVPEDNEAGLPNMKIHFPHWSEVTGISKQEAVSKVQNWNW